MLSGPQDGQVFGVDEHLDAAGLAWLAADQACAFEGQHHLVRRGRADAEVALHVCLGRRSAVDAGLGVDEGQVLPLVAGEAILRESHCWHSPFMWASPGADAAMNIRSLVELSEDERGALQAKMSG